MNRVQEIMQGIQARQLAQKNALALQQEREQMQREAGMRNVLNPLFKPSVPTMISSTPVSQTLPTADIMSGNFNPMNPAYTPPPEMQPAVTPTIPDAIQALGESGYGPEALQMQQQQEKLASATQGSAVQKELAALGLKPGTPEYAAAYWKRIQGSAGTSIEASPALLDAEAKGYIDPKWINSRNIAYWNSVAADPRQMDAVKMHSMAVGNTAAYGKQVVYAGNVDRAMGALDNVMPLLVESAHKVNTKGVPFVDNAITHLLSTTSGDPEVVKMVNTLNTARAEYATLLARGGSPTEGDKAEAAKAIPMGMPPETYQALLERMHAESEAIKKAARQTASDVFLNRGAPATGAGENAASNTQSSSNIPKIGTIEDGYMFMGGDPSKKSSWIKR